MVQSAQKGPNCLYYAIKRLLTEEQIRSPHGRICAARCKALTKIPFNCSAENTRARDVVNRLFLLSMGFDPDWIRIEHGGENALLLGGYGEIKEDALDDVNHATKEAIVNQLLSRFHDPNEAANMVMKQMEIALSYYLTLGYGLQEVAYRELSTIEGWVSTLQKVGALVMGSSLSKDCFATPPIELPSFTIGSHKIYSWPKNATLIPMITTYRAIHAIVVIGALKIDESREYIFWIDPNDPNDPKDPNSQRTYLTSFTNFMKNIYSFRDHLPTELMAQLRRDGGFTIAFYNPYSLS